MENASKALIMAGAVLIAILVISLGIMIFNNMSNSVKNDTSLDEQEIVAFNNKITPYVGKNKTGSQVNALIQTVRSINQSAINDNTNKTVEIKFPADDDSGETITLKVDESGETRVVSYYSSGSSTSQTVKSTGYYTVEAKYGSNGLISEITVTQNS